MNTVIIQRRVKFMRYSWFDKEYIELRKYMDSKASELNNHELKKGVEEASYFAKGTSKNYGCFDIDGWHVCYFVSKSFSDMVEYQYKTAFQRVVF